MSFVVIMVVMVAFMYLLLIRPQRSQQKRHKALIDAMKPGDEVITAGGIYGDVVAIDDDKVHLLIAEDVEIEVARRSIASVVPAEELGELELEEAQEELVDETREALEEDAETAAAGRRSAQD